MIRAPVPPAAAAPGADPEHLGPHLAWAARVLYSRPGVQVTLGGGRPAGDVVAEYAVLPDARRARLLVPLRWPRAAGASLRQFNDGMSQRARVAKAAAGAAVRHRLLPRSRGDRLVVSVNGATADHNGAAPTLEEHLRAVFDEPGLVVAIGLGPARPNRKPVLQALSPDGRVLGYVKVGWNDLTRGLVDNEAQALAAWSRRPPQRFDVPRLIHHGAWHDLDVTAVSPVPHRLLRRGPRSVLPPVELTREIAGLGLAREAPLHEGPFWQELLLRVASLEPTLRDPLRRALATLSERHAHRPVALGSWHGDWSPWNMSRMGGRLHVWDWERSADGVPVGLDVVHYLFQVRFHGGGRDVDAAAAGTLAAAGPPLRDLGVREAADRLLLCLSMIELLLRFEEGRAQEVHLDTALTRAIAGAVVRHSGHPA